MLALALTRQAVPQVIRPIPFPGRIEAENDDTNGPEYPITKPEQTTPVAPTEPMMWTLKPLPIPVDGTTSVRLMGECLNYTVSVNETAIYRFDFSNRFGQRGWQGPAFG